MKGYDPTKDWEAPCCPDRTADQITVRQHFAALAMQAIRNSERAESTWMTPQEVAESAVAQADALIAELNRKKDA